MNPSPRTALVIDAHKLAKLCMDGPALKVTMQYRSPLLFPLRRVARIHIIGTPDIGMDTLMHCAEQQVPVAFFNAHGRLRCRLLPPANENARIGHWLEHIEFDPEAQGIYREWQLNQALHSMAKFGFNIGARGSRLKLVDDTLRHLCRQKMDKKDFLAAIDWFDGMLQFQLEQMLDTIGLSQNPCVKTRLLADIKPICQIPLLHGLACRVNNGKEFRVTPQTMTALYQRQSDQIEHSVSRMLSQLATSMEAIN